jgi:hypothetical protein
VKLEKLAEDENTQASGMGLITIMQDYLAQIGWKIENLEDNSEVKIVTTMVQLAI